MKWEDAQIWEKNWHNNCCNSYQEESKQIAYAKRMGLQIEGTAERYPVINFHNKTVIDIGGGPYSLLLKGINVKGTVVDPLDIPDWCKARYASASIRFVQMKAEDYCKGHYDIGLIYNTLQHTENPKKIIENMKKMCEVIYIHEWLDTPISDGHIQTIKENELNEWLDGTGIIGYEKWSNTVSTKYFCGIFI